VCVCACVCAYETCVHKRSRMDDERLIENICYREHML
jgi:hypothetical protein